MIRRRLLFPCWCVICFAVAFFLGTHPFLEAASDDLSAQLSQGAWSRLSDGEKERLWSRWQEHSLGDAVVNDGWAEEAPDLRAPVFIYDSFIE